MSKVGRNEPCPCGSGKKYKKCCLKKGNDFLMPFADFPAIKQYPQENQPLPIKSVGQAPLDEEIRLLEEAVLNAAMKKRSDHIREAKDHLGMFLFRITFKGFSNQYVTQLLDKAQESFVIPWALYNWVPDLFEQLEQDKKEENITDTTIAVQLQESINAQLTEGERVLFSLLNRSHFSFYQVKTVAEDGSFVLVDLLLGNECTVFDEVMVKKLEEGDILFARIIHHKECDRVYGVWPMVIPPCYYERICDFKEQCVELNNNPLLNYVLFRARFEFDARDILSIIVVNMVEKSGGQSI